MKITDFIFLTAIAGSSALSFQREWYSWSLFFGLFFLIALAAVSLHYICSPLPRFVIGLDVIPVEEIEPDPEKK